MHLPKGRPGIRRKMHMSVLEGTQSKRQYLEIMAIDNKQVLKGRGKAGVYTVMGLFLKDEWGRVLESVFGNQGEHLTYEI